MSSHSSVRGSAPPLWLAAVAALAATAGVALGDWQLDRAAANRELRERYAAATAAPAITLERAPRALDPALRYRHVELVGRYDPRRQVLLDNRIENGRVGYEVLTPLHAAGGGPAVLVNRGWLPADPDRRNLPAVDVGAVERRVVGMLDRLPEAGLALDPPDGAADAGPLVVLSYPDAARLEAALGFPVGDYQLRLDPAEPDGYVRTRTPPGLPPERNVAYAVQWFALAAAAAAGGVWVLVQAVRRRRVG